MNYELLLAARMACTNTQARKEYFAEFSASYGSTEGGAVMALAKDGASGISTEIDAVVADYTAYEPGEPRPTIEAIQSMKSILRGAEQQGSVLPAARAGTYYGELDATWEKDNRILRLITYSDSRKPLIYFCTDNGQAMIHGESIQPAGASELADKLQWLVG